MSTQTTPASAFSAEDLDVVYTEFCHTMTQVGEPQAHLFMARFALLAMGAVGDRAVLQRLIWDAAADLTPTPSA